MKITIVSAVFPPEPIVSAKTSYSLAVGLVDQNYQVRVIADFPSRPEGKLYPGYRRSLNFSVNDPAGFRLVRCFSFLSKESSMISRWMENISFGLTSSWSLLFSRRPDAVYSNSWPVFATGFICLACKIRGIPLVLSIQDLYPESLVIQSRLRPDQRLYRILFFIDKWITKQADEIVLLSESHAKSYVKLRNIASTKVHIIANWVDQNSIELLGKNDYRKEAGISSDAFVILYGGNVGKAAGVETIIEAMRSLNTETEIVLVIAGSGSELTACQKLASTIENVRILFHTPWKPEETSKVLAAADVLILPTQGTQSLVSVPSKLLSYLLAAKPVLAMVLPESDSAQVIKNAGCGWVVPPDNMNLLAEKIKEIVGVPKEMLEEMGFSGREYALNNFTTESSLPKVIQIIENIVDKVSQPV
jgi:glycosyltransferase involved in cell wall biosynthesis